MATKKATLLDIALVLLLDIKKDMEKVIPMANESATNQDIKSVEKPVIALVIVPDIKKEGSLL